MAGITVKELEMQIKTKQTSLALVEQHKTEPSSVECLGLTFLSEDARRGYFTSKLRVILMNAESLKIDGFPIGDIEEIVALSDPPYYTACPNPFFGDMISHYGKAYVPDDGYRCEPFASDVSVGKNDTIYMAHSYHTKVPHQAILRYILRYTKPGDIVLGGFCGSGMTGVAASLCDDLPAGEKAAIEREMLGVEWERRIAWFNQFERRNLC